MAYIREEKHFNLQSVKLITRFCNNQQPQMVRKRLFDKEVTKIDCNDVSHQQFPIYVRITLMFPKFIQVGLYSGEGSAYTGGLYLGC